MESGSNTEPSSLVSKVDSQEPEVIWKPLASQGWQRRRLLHGDFELGAGMESNPLVERKHLSQLLSDIGDGTLVRQCRSLVAATPFPILMPEGHWYMKDGEHLLDTQWTWLSVWNQLQTIQDMGCRLQLTTCREHTITRLLELVDYYKKDLHESAIRQVAGDYRLSVLCLIPGIGEIKAKRILARFRSLADLANATSKELSEVEGLGESLALRIARWFRGEDDKQTG